MEQEAWEMFEKAQRCPSGGEEKDPYYVETPYGFQLDLDFLKYVDDIERGNAVKKKLSLQRRPRPRPPGGEWASTDSLSSSNSDEKPPAPLSPAPFRQAPLSPAPFRAHPDRQGKLSPRFEARHNPPNVEKTLMETRRRLEQERVLMLTHADPMMMAAAPSSPRRRLASFGGATGSNSSLSSHSGSGSGSIHQNQNGLLLQANGDYYRPIRHSPASSGVATPTTTTPTTTMAAMAANLQQIREQMSVALRRLKELEEQAKTIPVLQVKIAVLQEEKRQLVAQSKGNGGVAMAIGGGFRKRSYSVGSADQMESNKKEAELHISEPENAQRLDEFRRLAAEVQALDGTSDAMPPIAMATASPKPNASPNAMPNASPKTSIQKSSIGVVTDENMNNLWACFREFPRCRRDVATATERPDTRSASSSVTEAMLGVGGEAEREIELQQQAIDALREKVYRLEVQLKEATHETEMAKLKMEIMAAAGKRTADKGLTVRPETYDASVEAKVHTRDMGVGGHLGSGGETALASRSVGVSCRIETQNAVSGPEEPMDRWEVKRRAEVKDECVGVSMETGTASDGEEMARNKMAALASEEMVMKKMAALASREMAVLASEEMARNKMAALASKSVGVSCRVETQNAITGPENPMDDGVGTSVETGMASNGDEEMARNKMAALPSGEMAAVASRSVGCGDCSVDVIVSPVKSWVSRGTDAMATVLRVDSGVMATPESVARETNTNTEVEAEVRVANKATNTAPAETRTVAAGEGLVKEPVAVARTRSVAVGTMADNASVAMEPLAKTRDCGVGPASIHENFLIGLKTRNMACGPSTVAVAEGDAAVAVGTMADNASVAMEPLAKTRDCGVGPASIHENFLIGLKTRNMACGPSQVAVAAGDAAVAGGDGGGLDHYIERVQRLLAEQQMLLAENYGELAEAFGTPQFGSINKELEKTLTTLNAAIRHEDAANKEGPRRLQNSAPSSLTEKSPVKDPVSSSGPLQPISAAEQKSLMDLQMSTALHGQPGTLKSIMKKKDGRPESNGTKKNLQFVGVNGGYETTSSDDSSSEDSSSSGSEEEEEDEEEKEAGGEEEKEEKEKKKVEGKGEELQTEGAENVDQKEEEESSEKKRERYELSEKMLAACNVLKTHLSDPKAVSSKDLRACLNTVQLEWFRVSSQKAALAAMLDDHLRALVAVAPGVLRLVVNMADGNGNTALHYSVSHSNFQVVKKLLDADVCNVDQQNKAGYTPIMLAALAAVETPEDMNIVEELFSKGDVNARASQAGQTGLMLAVSHGRMDMVRALLAAGADVNLQDDEGSTALMCASEHGHAAIVQLLLATPGCDATLSDGDESSALSIALEAGHKDIAVLLYAHVNFSKAQSPGTPRLGRKTSPSPTRKGKFD
ncbi:KN motif and ankyrin repeat domain-containing protein 1a isoform 2-T3 [Menidia menidia]